MIFRRRALCALTAILCSPAFLSHAQGSGGASEANTSAVFTQGTTVLEGADRRPQVSLDGDWRTIVDPYFSGFYNFHHEEKPDGWFRDEHWQGVGDNRLLEYDFAHSPTLRVPGDWNTQRDSLFYYEGTVWYERTVSWKLAVGKRVFLHVGAANYRSWFWVNGQKACRHEGGFTTFDCEVTSLLHDGDNSIVSAVNNQRLPDGVPTLETDWWNYGGLTRSVALIELPQAYISGYDLHIDRATRSRIEGWVQLTGARAGDTVSVSLPELHAGTTATVDAAGRAAIAFTPKKLKLWAPLKPVLYDVTLSAGADTVHESMGFKTIETRGTEILVNGDPIFLRGISIHAEAPFRTGRANTQKDMDTLLGWAAELGCNYVRLAHYPHDEKMTRTADRMGLLVWSEIPTYWAIHFSDPTVLVKAKQQLEEEIARDRNRVSIGLWSIANETPRTDARTQFLTALATDVRRLDPERLVTAAVLIKDVNSGKPEKVVDDKLGEVLDVIGVNEYIGWYEGKPESADTTHWTITYQKPMIISEFGGDAKYGLHGTADQRWTEEYQASIYRHNLPMIAAIPQVRGISPWILMDFRAPVRQLPGVQDLFNRKGLISPDGQKKQAFSVLQQAYRSGWGNAQ